MAFTRNGTTLQGSAGSDTLDTFANSPELLGINNINAVEADDLIEIDGTLDGVSVRGGNGDDVISLGTIKDDAFVSGNADDDLIEVDNATDGSTVTGGSGNDTITVNGLHNASVRGGSEDDRITLTGDVSGVSDANGADGNDLLDARGVTSGVVVLRGGADNDTLYGSNGNDLLISGSGDDILVAGEGNDTMEGGAGSDLFDFTTENFSSDDLVDGNGDQVDDPGIDVLQILGDTPVVGDMANVSEVEILNLGDDDDEITLTEGADFQTIKAGGGSDIIDASEIDTDIYIDGGESPVTYEKPPGNGGNNNGQPREVIDGDDELIGGSGDDTLLGGNAEDLLTGNDGNDLLEGGDHDDELDGDDGNDQLFGNDGQDILDGGDDDDTLDGGNDDDDLEGGDDADRLTGGGDDEDNDTFIFQGDNYSKRWTDLESDGSDDFIGYDEESEVTFDNGVDVITDFNVDEDYLQVDSEFAWAWSPWTSLDGYDVTSSGNWDDIYYIYGDWNEATQTFDVDADGDDALISCIYGGSIEDSSGWIVIEDLHTDGNEVFDIDLIAN